MEDAGDDKRGDAGEDTFDAGAGEDDAGSAAAGDDAGCPADVVCITSLPATVSGTTTGGSQEHDAYACGAQDESGPERVYRVTLPAPGTLVVTLDDALEDAADTDVDVHILSSREADACRARGDRRAFASFASTDALEAWVVLDSYVDADGSVGAGAFSASFVFSPVLDDPSAAVLTAVGVRDEVAALAMHAYAAALSQDLTDSATFSVIDYSLPSTALRLWVVDVATGALLVNDRVTHGSGSNSADDPAVADAFSNEPGSFQSSLGLARTAETYEGSNGYSLRLDGLESANSNMRDRAIVMHGALYAEDSFVDENGYLGRSNGCPAVAMSRSADVIDLVKEGTLVFSYYPDAAWLAGSEFLQ